MASGTQKAVLAVFLSTTIVFAVFILYTTNLYFLVFKGVRSFNVETPQFNVRLVNSSYISTTTNVTLQNPSELALEVRQMTQVLYLYGKYIVSKSVSISDQIQIMPGSTAWLTVEAEIPFHRLNYVIANLEGEWVIYLRIFLRAPLVDEYSWDNSWSITEATIVQVQIDAQESHNAIIF